MKRVGIALIIYCEPANTIEIGTDNWRYNSVFALKVLYEVAKAPLRVLGGACGILLK
jgi:hypothetical protein